MAIIVVFSHFNDNIVAINKELPCIKYLIHNDLLYLVAIVADLFQKKLHTFCFHIGVGSDVVCSTLIGSWKSLSVWNGQQNDSTLEPVYVL